MVNEIISKLSELKNVVVTIISFLQTAELHLQRFTDLEQLKSCLNIKIPNEEISLLLLSTPDKVLDGDCLIDTDDDTWGVEDEEHNDGHNEDD